MAGKISEYANAVATFADGDLVDVSKRISTSPDTFQSQKVEFAQFQAFIQANASNILNTNGLTLGGNYSHNLNSNYLTFTNGTLNIEQGSLLVRAETNLGSTTVLFSKLNGDPMWTFLDDGNLNLGSSPVATLTDTLRFKNGIVEVQGSGISGSSLLSLYDGQATPVKLWDFLDNGNVSVTQSSSFLLSANKTLKVDGSSNTNQNSFEVNSSSSFLGQGTFKIGTYGKVEIQSRDGSGTFKVLTTTGNEYFTLDANGNQSTLRTKAFDIGTSTTTGYKISSDSGKHQFIRNGIVGGYFDLVNSKIQFWEAGMTSRKFIVGGSALIGTEKISLQGDTLLNANVNMPNLPTSATGLSSGDIWNDGGTLKIA